jgi:hypothetical protein
MTASELLKLPFDQYGRYHIIRQALEALGRERLRVLDVGGYFQNADGTPRLPAQQFLPAHDVTVLDVEPCALPGYVQGDGKALRFADNSFDFVITCDTLEHIPAAERARFCGELLRVARLGVLLICPFDDQRVVLAERILAAYIRAELGGEQLQLKEHRDYGLPRFELVRAIFEQAGCVFHTYPSGDIYAWLPMMLAKHYLEARDRANDLLRTGLDELYNSSYAQADRREPSYRRLFVVARRDEGGWLAAVDAALAPTVRPPGPDGERTWLGLSVQLLNLLQLGLDDRRDERRAAHLREHIAFQDRLIADQVRQMDHLHARIAMLEDALLWREGQLDELHKRAAWLEGQANEARGQLSAVQNGLVMRVLRRLGR